MKKLRGANEIRVFETLRKGAVMPFLSVVLGVSAHGDGSETQHECGVFLHNQRVMTNMQRSREARTTRVRPAVSRLTSPQPRYSPIDDWTAKMHVPTTVDPGRMDSGLMMRRLCGEVEMLVCWDSMQGAVM